MGDYSTIVQAVESLDNCTLVSIIGEVKCDFFYPLYRLIAGNDDGNPKSNVLISGGIHGTEPAGVHAVLEFLEKHAQKYTNDFRFFAYPCINPWGFVNNNYFNYREQEINNLFYRKSKTKEGRIVQGCLLDDGVDYLFTMDFHEDRSTYLLESCSDSENLFADYIIQAFKENGIQYQECQDDYISGMSFDDYLYKYYTDHAFTIESNLERDLKSRVKTHIIALETALKNYRKRLKKSM
ncbi:MAG: succinylglutamate desuccinylase/aspartoacylase family protein [archaeon]